MLGLFSKPPARQRPRVLRDYQRGAIRNIFRVLDQRPILVSPTGSGKTVMASAICREIGLPALWLAHRIELIEQAAKSLRANGLYTGIIKAGIEPEPSAPVQVASVQSLVTRHVPHVDVIFIDECHHATAASYQNILARFPKAIVIGLTATPFRLDGRGLGDLFRSIVVSAHCDELVRDSYLHSPRVYAASVPDLRGVKISAGEYSMAQAVSRLCPVNEIVNTWKQRADGLQTVAFAADVNDSRELAAAFVAAGVRAEHLDGETPADERSAILERLATRKTQVVSNCLVLTEGWDLPSLECAILRRPTASLNLHLQMIGRVMRSCEGKSGAVVLDHAGNHHMHGLVTRRLNYSLDGSVKVGSSEPLGLRQCRQCFVLYDNKLPACPGCGFTPMPQHRVSAGPSGTGEVFEFNDEDFDYRQKIWHLIEAEREANDYKPGWSLFRFVDRFGVRPVLWEVDGRRELVDVKHASKEQKESVYGGLLEIARSKNLNPGWASHRYREMFGVWPSGFVGRSKRNEIAERWAARVGAQ